MKDEKLYVVFDGVVQTTQSKLTLGTTGTMTMAASGGGGGGGGGA